MKKAEVGFLVSLREVLRINEGSNPKEEIHPKAWFCFRPKNSMHDVCKKQPTCKQNFGNDTNNILINESALPQLNISSAGAAIGRQVLLESEKKPSTRMRADPKIARNVDANYLGVQ